MLWKIPKFEKGVLSPENPHEHLKHEEARLHREMREMLSHLTPEELRRTGSRLLAAFALVMGASSAFAQEPKGEEIVPPAQAEVLKSGDAKEAKEKPSRFSWSEIVKNIEFSMGNRVDGSKPFTPDVVSPEALYGIENIQQSNFYKGMSAEQYAEARSATPGGFQEAQNVTEFFAYLSGRRAEFSDQQKILILQNMGLLLSRTYNFDMFEAGQHVVVGDNVMFNAAKDLYLTGKMTPTGICGNIHTFLTKQAGAMGMETWLQSGELKENRGHVWTGLVTEVQGQKQIGFLNYGEFVPTGTMDYQDALGVWERYQTSIATFNSYIGNTDKILFPVKSRAQEVVEHAAGMDKNKDRFERGLLEGKIEKETVGLKIGISPETTEVKLDAHNFGVSVLHFEDTHGNPFQSLESLTALGAKGRFGGGEHFNFEAGATVLHMNTKDLYGGSAATNEIIARVAAEYINKKQLTKNEYGEFLYHFGTTLEAAVRRPLQKKEAQSQGGTKNIITSDSGSTELTTGSSLVYIDPGQLGKFYIGATETFRMQGNDFQNQKQIVEKAAQSFVVGGQVKVHEGTIVNFEATKSKYAWGKGLEVKAGATGEKMQGEVSYEKKDSNFGRFVPSSTTLEAKVGYKISPKWRVDIIGAQTEEQYKGAPKTNNYNVGVRFTIFLWGK